jgi:6-pyruvoyltetrahydropterin/6-carboxytetrahydropterin synthase
MTRISKEFWFEAAHQLPYHDGKCARLHGHSYRCEVDVSGEVILPDPLLALQGSLATKKPRRGTAHPDHNPKMGFVMDFADLSSFLKALNEVFLDHFFLNETLVDTGYIPRSTAEFISAWIFGMVYRHFTEQVTAVRVYETRTSCAETRLEDYVPLEEGGHIVVSTALADRDADPAALGSGRIGRGLGTGQKQAPSPVEPTGVGSVRANRSRRRSDRR